MPIELSYLTGVEYSSVNPLFHDQWNQYVNKYRNFLFKNNILANGMVKATHPIFNDMRQLIGVVNCIWNIEVDWDLVYPIFVSGLPKQVDNFNPKAGVVVPSRGNYRQLSCDTVRSPSPFLLMQSDWACCAIRGSVLKVDFEIDDKANVAGACVSFLRQDGMFYRTIPTYCNFTFGNNRWVCENIKAANQDVLFPLSCLVFPQTSARNHLYLHFLRLFNQSYPRHIDDYTGESPDFPSISAHYLLKKKTDAPGRYNGKTKAEKNIDGIETPRGTLQSIIAEQEAEI